MLNEHESTDIIRIDHLNKTFGDVKAVNDLSFRVKKGELFAFLGYQRTAEWCRSKDAITKKQESRPSG